MPIVVQVEIFLQLLLATFLSGLIGMERERRDKSAGLRTHMLAGLGACVFSALGLYAFPEADQSRVAAAVVSGIGFLGAGMIFQTEDRAHDLTTAASIWVTSAVGMAVGVGAWFIAIGLTVLVWIILAVIHSIEIRVYESS